MPRPDGLVVGFETSDDAGVFRMQGGGMLVQTVDFITPVVDDAHTFGRISALNSLSDVYAMGGSPMTAMSVLLYACECPPEMIKGMLQGAVDELTAAGCALVGGHTVNDTEVKLGFSITGTLPDETYYRNCTLRDGDVLVYTQPLGIGILTTAIKGDMASPEEITRVTDAMLLSNERASKLLRRFDVSAVTDITGFGLAGHGWEMAKGSGVSIGFELDAIPVIDGAAKQASMGIVPAGAHENRQFLTYDTACPELPGMKHIIYFDPQTSGGLLIGVREADAAALVAALKAEGYADAAVIGSVSPKTDTLVTFK